MPGGQGREQQHILGWAGAAEAGGGCKLQQKKQPGSRAGWRQLRCCFGHPGGMPCEQNKWSPSQCPAAAVAPWS